MGAKEGPRLAALLVSAANPTPDQSVRTLPGNRRNLSRTEALSSCRSSVVLSSLLQALRLACRPATADPRPATADPLRSTEGLCDLRVLCTSQKVRGRENWGLDLGTGRELVVSPPGNKKGHLLAFPEPSDGLEPSTPSLPWNFSGNRSQRTAT